MKNNTVVVNLRKEPYDVYIGRAGKGQLGTFGNPYHVGKICSRCKKQHLTAEDTLPCYEEHLRELLKQKSFCYKLMSLKGKRLGCFCKPGPCHGDVIVKVLKEL